ncbi:MAG: DUF2628 domain-containing protein [Acetobacteraceae bacterium]|nr:DUF2628 domain-containing protein [Acetobacteraceae bacterium]
MRVWTVHLPAAPVPEAGTRTRRKAKPPVLVPEGFSWLALFFNLFWLLFHRLWLAALAYVAVVLALALLLPEPAGAVAAVAVQFLLACHAQDLRRWALARRGYRLAHVVAERDVDLALARLLDARPDLTEFWSRAALPKGAPA